MGGSVEDFRGHTLAMSAVAAQGRQCEAERESTRHDLGDASFRAVVLTRLQAEPHHEEGLNPIDEVALGVIERESEGACWPPVSFVRTALGDVKTKEVRDLLIQGK